MDIVLFLQLNECTTYAMYNTNNNNFMTWNEY
jgi:hypothetical protein